MPFGNYKTLGEAMVALQITSTKEDFVRPEPIPVSDFFRREIDINLERFPVECSEWAVCETLIFPVLREVAKTYSDALVVWSHVSLFQDGCLQGVPDYLIAKRSALGTEVMGSPVAMMMEAKRNDFDAGWGQCLAAMCAAQNYNGDPRRTIYGCVSDGFVWRFAKLHDKTLSRHSDDYTLSRLNELLAALNHVFLLCKEQVLSPAHAA